MKLREKTHHVQHRHLPNGQHAVLRIVSANEDIEEHLNSILSLSLCSVTQETCMFELVEKDEGIVDNVNITKPEQNNAKPHTANKTKNKSEESNGVEVLRHAAYTLDVAPCDFPGGANSEPPLVLTCVVSGLTPN
ncbi:hypothetical protein KIN20_033179 [Parelaphostrongylus tenuis]|uniref:Uncharacterized protein n=1 Tax=Parelaphostrongylus tenuis TaxID=148309 RepID=A0AAD5R875_PARTN|nr:hypothetical protein KIN20_033179 [Parelaphostrongylus tenuis]